MHLCQICMTNIDPCLHQICIPTCAKTLILGTFRWPINAILDQDSIQHGTLAILDCCRGQLPRICPLCVSYIVRTAASPRRMLFPVSRPIRHHMHLIPMSCFSSARHSQKRRALALVNDFTATLQSIWHGSHGHCGWSNTDQRLQPLLHLILNP